MLYCLSPLTFVIFLAQKVSIFNFKLKSYVLPIRIKKYGNLRWTIANRILLILYYTLGKNRENSTRNMIYDGRGTRCEVSVERQRKIYRKWCKPKRGIPILKKVFWTFALAKKTQLGHIIGSFPYFDRYHTPQNQTRRTIEFFATPSAEQCRLKRWAAPNRFGKILTNPHIFEYTDNILYICLFADNRIDGRFWYDYICCYRYNGKMFLAFHSCCTAVILREGRSVMPTYIGYTAQVDTTMYSRGAVKGFPCGLRLNSLCAAAWTMIDCLEKSWCNRSMRGIARTTRCIIWMGKLCAHLVSMLIGSLVRDGYTGFRYDLEIWY